MSKVYYKDSPIVRHLYNTIAIPLTYEDYVNSDLTCTQTPEENEPVYICYFTEPLWEEEIEKIQLKSFYVLKDVLNDHGYTYTSFSSATSWNNYEQNIDSTGCISSYNWYANTVYQNNQVIGLHIYTSNGGSWNHNIVVPDDDYASLTLEVTYQTKLYQLTADIVGAAPALHSHNASSIGMIPMSKGGLQNNLTASLSSFVGPLRTNSVNSIINLHSQDFTTTGVYYATSSNDTSVSVGTAGWAQGAIPYNTQEDQIKALYKTVSLGDTIFFQNIVCAGMMFSNGKTIIAPLNIYYQIPTGTTSITLAGGYVIRVNGYYMFTSGTNYATSSSGVNFSEKPSNISSVQTITMNTASNLADGTGWSVAGGGNSLYQPILRLRRDSQTAQTTAYSYASTYGGTTSSCVGKAWGPAVVNFINLEITFNGS